jgi:pimeloyl-ACP methyl ester carboxylesterase
MSDDDRFAELPKGVRICYRSYGPPARETIVLIAGLGLQLTSWPEALVAALSAAGYRVIAPDNRDAGRSSSIGTPPPGKLQILLARPPADNYAIEDMADDLSQLLRLLGVKAAHVVGMSMGGMIGQSLAARHPEQVLSLTSIFSTTGARNVGQPALSTFWRLGKPAPRTSEEAVERFVAMMRHIGDPAVPGIESMWSDYASRGWARNGNRANAAGMARQIAAIQKSGDRTAELRRIRARTLVLHGDRDLMVNPTGGKASAAAIPGARHVTLTGLRHQLDDHRAPEIAALILSHIRDV